MENKKSQKSTSTTYSANSPNNDINPKEKIENCDDDEFYLEIDEDFNRRRYSIPYDYLEQKKKIIEMKNNLKDLHKNLSTPSVPKIPLLKRKSCPSPIKLTPSQNSSKFARFKFKENDIFIENDILTDKENSESDNSDSDSSILEEKSIVEVRKRYGSMMLIEEEDEEKNNNGINNIVKKLEFGEEDKQLFNIKLIRKEMNRSKKSFQKNDYKDSFNKIDFVIKENYLRFKKKVLANEKNKKIVNKNDSNKNNNGKNNPILNFLRKNSQI